MKILFDARVHLNYFSGISRYIICLLEAYLKQFPDDEMIILLNPTIRSDNSIHKTLNKFQNVRFETVHIAHMGPKNYLFMGRIIKKFNPDVYHYPHLDAPIYTGKIPVVATIHDTNSNEKIRKIQDRFGFKSMYFRKSLSLTLKHAKKIVFVSDSIKSEVLESFHLSDDPKKFHMIYNGLEEDFNKIDKNEVESTLGELGINQPYILYVGQIRQHKNIDRLIAGFKIFNDDFPEYKLILVGHNYMKRDLSEKNIVHIEKVTNFQLKSLYSQCNSFLFPSLFEGFGFPILEAFSFGKQVVTTDYGATKEISGELAILVDPRSEEEIAKGLKRSIVNDGNSEARIEHTKKFTWAKNASQIHSLYVDAFNLS